MSANFLGPGFQCSHPSLTSKRTLIRRSPLRSNLRDIPLTLELTSVPTTNTVMMNNRNEQNLELDEEKASREDASEAQLPAAELFYIDPKAESRYVTRNACPCLFIHVL